MKHYNVSCQQCFLMLQYSMLQCCDVNASHKHCTFYFCTVCTRELCKMDQMIRVPFWPTLQLVIDDADCNQLTGHKPHPSFHIAGCQKRVWRLPTDWGSPI